MPLSHSSVHLLSCAILLCACASLPYRIADRRITPLQWEAVRECVIMSASAAGKESVVADFAVSVPTYTKRGGIEDIRFRWESHGGPGFTVRSELVVRDIRQGLLAPMQGASVETRRLRQQLDQQCLQSYPIVERASAS